MTPTVTRDKDTIGLPVELGDLAYTALVVESLDWYGGNPPLVQVDVIEKMKRGPKYWRKDRNVRN